MSEAEEVATRLAYEFLRMGRYSASAGPVEVPWLSGAAAAVDGNGIEQFSERFAEFSGLLIQSVGFEAGVDEPKVHVYLTHGAVRQMKALPNEINDVPVRVHKMGAINVKPEVAAAATNRGNIFERNNRMCCGSSCGPTSERSTGTFGAIVRRVDNPDLFLLSNNHVFAGCNHVPQGQPILYPSSADGRPDAPAPHEIARHQLIHELRSGDPHFVEPSDADMALAQVTDPNSISSWQGDAVHGYDTPHRAMEPAALQRVKKFGRTTGLTFGEIEAKVNTPMPVTYTSTHFKGKVWFRSVWTVRAQGSQYFALPGDSGSLVVSEDGEVAVGLVFAANSSGEYAWMIPMPHVLASFDGLRLVVDHGV